MADEVLYERRGRIAIITLNRPDKLNALNTEVFNGLTSAWTRFQNEDDAWVAILRGAGRAFCAGADLGNMAAPASGAEDGDLLHPSRTPGEVPIMRVTPRGLDIFKPTIAAVQGYAVAGGFWMAMDCHMCMAAETAEFGITEPRWNLPGGWAADGMRHINLRHAVEITVVPRRISAARAYEMEFVNWVVPDDELMDRALETAEAVLENAPAACRAYIETYYRTHNLPYEQAVALAGHIHKHLISMEDGREGPRAFMEKRKPEFKNR